MVLPQLVTPDAVTRNRPSGSEVERFATMVSRKVRPRQLSHTRGAPDGCPRTKGTTMRRLLAAVLLTLCVLATGCDDGGGGGYATPAAEAAAR